MNYKRLGASLALWVAITVPGCFAIAALGLSMWITALVGVVWGYTTMVVALLFHVHLEVQEYLQ